MEGGGGGSSLGIIKEGEKSQSGLGVYLKGGVESLSS